jgi:hypothetical protein
MDGCEESTFGRFKRVAVGDGDCNEKHSGRERAVGWSDDGGVEVGEVVLG